MRDYNYSGEYINKTNHHIYIAPTKELHDIIAHYTITFPNEISSSSEKYHILPDASGCFIFQGNKRYFWGAMSEIVVLENDLQKAPHRFFIEFKAGGLYQVSGLAQKKYVNIRGNLTDFSSLLDYELKQIYNKCDNYMQLIDNLNMYFLCKRKNNNLKFRFIKAKQLIDNCQGNISIKNIINRCQISPSQLLRDFHYYIGLSGKEYAKVVRFNYLLKQLNENNILSIALQGGYFDQSHFNKDFKEITKTTPKKYLSNMEDFYNEIYKF